MSGVSLSMMSVLELSKIHSNKYCPVNRQCLKWHFNMLCNAMSIGTISLSLAYCL